MKSTIKFSGVIAVVAMIGVALTACEGPRGPQGPRGPGWQPPSVDGPSVLFLNTGSAFVNANYNAASGNPVTVERRMGNTRGLVIYLPFNYDPNREEPFNVLFISMGASGDQIGNEMRWFHEGAGANILDNIFAETNVEPFIMVSGNWQDFGYNINLVSHDVFNYIIPYLEANFNVATSREGRAFAGLSMGGILASHFYLRHSDEFSQFGIFSAAATGAAFNNVNWDALRDLQDETTVVLSTGRWDWTTPSLYTFMNNLISEGISHAHPGVIYVPGGHDWQVWQLLLVDFITNYLWRDGASAIPRPINNNPAALQVLNPGPTVTADTNSPTGFTVTFTYRPNAHLDPMGIGLTPLVDTATITRVRLLSETMLLFDPTAPIFDGTNNQHNLNNAASLGMQHQPEEFEPGLVPAGGSGIHALLRDLVWDANAGVWSISFPLPSGAFEYRFIITSQGQDRHRLDDPANPTMRNTATGVRSLSSMVFVPWAPVQGNEPWANRSFTFPRAGQRGEVRFISYTVRYGVQIPNVTVR